MNIHADHTIWHDVYRSSASAGEVYLKLTVIDAAITHPCEHHGIGPRATLLRPRAAAIVSKRYTLPLHTAMSCPEFGGRHTRVTLCQRQQILVTCDQVIDISGVHGGQQGPQHGQVIPVT